MTDPPVNRGTHAGGGINSSGMLILDMDMRSIEFHPAATGTDPVLHSGHAPGCGIWTDIMLCLITGGTSVNLVATADGRGWGTPGGKDAVKTRVKAAAGCGRGGLHSLNNALLSVEPYSVMRQLPCKC